MSKSYLLAGISGVLLLASTELVQASVLPPAFPPLSADLARELALDGYSIAATHSSIGVFLPAACHLLALDSLPDLGIGFRASDRPDPVDDREPPADAPLTRKAPEPLSLLIWLALGFAWVGLRAVRGLRQHGVGLWSRQPARNSRRERWSDETREAINRVIERGCSRR